MNQNFKFNEQTCSTNRPNLHYNELWTLGQQEAVRRLSVKTRIEFKDTARYELIKDFSTRAERIAGNYARIYLELEKNGKPELKGRFYWTGLAAFASKQVMCALDYSSNSRWRWTVAAAPLFDITMMHLGEGNFWLFQDIFVWHWFYINYPHEFNNAVPERNWNSYICEFKDTFQKLPWAADALPKVNFLAKTPPLEEGFALIQQVERVKDLRSRRDLQLASLMKIADHEQLWILQPLIYENWDFQLLLDGQAKMEGKLGVPRRLAAFSTQCETGNPELDVTMTKGDLYNDKDRMKFITKIADKYHKLMTTDQKSMEEVIGTIATWWDHA